MDGELEQVDAVSADVEGDGEQDVETGVVQDEEAKATPRPTLTAEDYYNQIVADPKALKRVPDRFLQEVLDRRDTENRKQGEQRGEQTAQARYEWQQTARKFEDAQSQIDAALDDDDADSLLVAQKAMKALRAQDTNGYSSWAGQRDQKREASPTAAFEATAATLMSKLNDFPDAIGEIASKHDKQPYTADPQGIARLAADVALAQQRASASTAVAVAEPAEEAEPVAVKRTPRPDVGGSVGGSGTGGPLTSKKFLEMTQEQREQAWREQPEAVRALS